MSTGVRVVGAADHAPDTSDEGRQDHDDVPEAAEPATDEVEAAEPATDEVVQAAAPGRTPAPAKAKRARAVRSPEVRRRRRAFAAVSAVAVLGVAGTLGFGLAWAGQHAQAQGEAQASASARSFLVALTNFDAKTVDADFSAITNMATGTFAGQATKFFNSSIRQELENALASSRGQIRSLYVQTYAGDQATVYAVVDQLYTNNKISSPQSDVLRVVVNLSQTNGAWKISNVTVLTGPTSSLGGATSGTGSSTSSTTSTTAAGG